MIPTNNTSDGNDILVKFMSEQNKMGFLHMIIMGDFNHPEKALEGWNTDGKQTFRLGSQYTTYIFDDEFLRPQLLALAKSSNQTPKYVLDKISRERVNAILRIPSNHPYLNPTELIQNQKKQCFASRNVIHSIDDVFKLAHEEVAEPTVSNWQKTCRNVTNVEVEYRKRDIVIDKQVESLIINLADSSDTESDNDDNV
ncbi:unnamed protein product [Mytilus coruscus]|uniref:Uncharacterized protein n=1 Tax=Mytilus coruscus TaxID=42192 RepID=A0A6J8BLV3_MYTCO|nr:unnamed protein product [Mytilus coruscus]